MATATKSLGKTSFVKEFLRKNPQGNTESVNEAWAAAGMKGTISHPVVSLVRKEQGLIGNQPAKTKKTAKARSANKMPKVASSPGKSMFVKEYLIDHPQGNFDAVNEAWQAAGFAGTISRTVVDRLRATLGLTGNLRGNTKRSKAGVKGKKRGRPRKETTAVVSVQLRRKGAIAPELWYWSTWKQQPHLVVPKPAAG